MSTNHPQQRLYHMKYKEYGVEDFLQDESFQAFALGQSETDKKFWTEWISRNPDKQPQVKEALSILTSFSIKSVQPDAENLEQDVERFKNRIKGGQKIRNTRFLSQWMKIAASVALIIGITAAAFTYVNYFKSKASQIVVEKSVPKGRKLTFTLPDGTKVKLNGDSYLKYEQNHLLKQRKVSLIGEGFFEVARDTINPFSVVSGGVMTTALGTSFNIKSYPGGSQTEIFLVTGSVLVASLKDPLTDHLTLEPGEGALYNNDDARIISFEFNKAEVLAWKDGIIKFKAAGIDEVLETLERWYGVTITVVNAPEENWRINGTFENESLENVIKNISYTTPLTYSLNDNTLVLTFKP